MNVFRLKRGGTYGFLFTGGVAVEGTVLDHVYVRDWCIRVSMEELPNGPVVINLAQVCYRWVIDETNAEEPPDTSAFM